MQCGVTVGGAYLNHAERSSAVSHHMPRGIEHGLIVSEDVNVHAARVATPHEMHDVRTHILRPTQSARELDTYDVALTRQVPCDVHLR